MPKNREIQITNYNNSSILLITQLHYISNIISIYNIIEYYILYMCIYKI